MGQENKIINASKAYVTAIGHWDNMVNKIARKIEVSAKNKLFECNYNYNSTEEDLIEKMSSTLEKKGYKVTKDSSILYISWKNSEPIESTTTEENTETTTNPNKTKNKN